MNDAQLSIARDQLIALVDKGPSPLAVKFQPALQDRLNGKESTPEEMVVLKQQVMALALAAHDVAIAALRSELAKDPEAVGYAGKTPQEIQTLLTTERPVYVDVPVAPTFEEKVALVVAAMVPGTKAPAIEEKTVSTLLMVKAPPITIIWRGIPYCRNLPSIDNILEALA